TAKNLFESPDPPLLAGVDHFLCHSVQRPRGAAAFEPVPGVRVEDQFGSRRVDLIAPTPLCAPADKNGEAPDAPQHREHLLCYQAELSPLVVQPAAGTDGPPDVIAPLFQSPASAIYTNNQVGPDGMAALDVEELCIPSAKNPRGDSPAELDCDDGIFC